MPAYAKSLPALSSACALLLLFNGQVTARAVAPAASEDVRKAFVAAMQRVRQNLPDTPDPAALEAYVIHDYLVAARLRRDLLQRPDESVDTAIDSFLQAHSGQPVARGLRQSWLASLAERRRWEQFLPRSVDVTCLTMPPMCSSLSVGVDLTWSSLSP